jgi:tetratricopeptide (TPR) repeat protein
MMPLLLCLAMLVAPSAAERQLADRLGELQSVIRASGSTSEQRVDALQERLALRAQAMSRDDSDDVTMARLACDQAEDLLSTGLSLDRLGLQVLYGHPTPAERARADARIAAGLAAVIKAELAVEQVIFELERIPASRRSAVQRENLLHLREQERDLRLPLLRGIGLVHRAECDEEGAVRAATMREAAAALFELDERLDGQASARASWLRGLALVRTDRYEDAETAFRKAATSADAGVDEVLAARLGGVVNRTHVHGPERGARSAQLLLRRYEEPGQLRDHLLVSDHLASLHGRLDDVASAARVWNGMQPILIGAGVDERAARAMIDERIRRLPVTDPIRSGSIDLLLAHMGDSDVDAATLIDALRGALESDDLDEDHRARSMAGLGASLVRDRQPTAACRVLLDLATSMPRRREAGPAIDTAARLALETSLARPTNAEARALAVSVLDVLLTEFPYRPGIDGWRMAAARLATGDARWSDALRAYDLVVSDAPEVQDAIRESATVLRLASRDQAWDAGTLDVVDEIAVRRRRGDAATKTVVDLVLIDVLLDQARTAEAADVIARVESVTLTAAQQAMLDTLRLRAAEGDADAIARAAQGVAARGGTDGGAAIASALRQALQSLDAESARTGRAPDEARIRTEVEPVADALARWLQEQEADDAASRLLVAEAYRRSGRFSEALAIADSILQQSPDAGDVLFERAENLHALGGSDRLAEAMLIYRRLGRADRSAAPRRWWWSQLRMLQILASLERNTDRIGPRIRQLQNDDPALGGEDIRLDFESLSIRFQ